MSSLPIVDFNSEDLNRLPELFHANGFAQINNVFDDNELNEIKKAISVIVDNFDVNEHPKSVFSTYDESKHASDTYFLDSVDKVSFFYEENVFGPDGELLVEKQKALNKIGHDLHGLYPVFGKYTHHEKIQQIIKKIGAIEPKIVQSMYIFKQPKIGGAVTDHVDATFLQADRMSSVVGVWIPIDDADLENGCLWFIPGSHKVESLDYRFVRTHTTDAAEPLLKFIGTKPVYDQTAFVPVPVKKGSLVLIDGLVVHKSEPNTSSQSRHAYAFHLHDAKDSTWSPDNWLQPTKNYQFPYLYK